MTWRDLTEGVLSEFAERALTTAAPHVLAAMAMAKPDLHAKEGRGFGVTERSGDARGNSWRGGREATQQRVYEKQAEERAAHRANRLALVARGGWFSLPCGGAAEFRDGLPVTLSDEGDRKRRRSVAAYVARLMSGTKYPPPRWVSRSVPHHHERPAAAE